MNILKKEYKKVKLLNPKKYILSTTVNLNPGRKDKILKVFNGYIKSTGDIIGRDDINNLLEVFPDIEKKHFKLWLSSTNIMERVLHSKVYNQSCFEENEINDDINIYVVNDSYSEALTVMEL